MSQSHGTLHYLQGKQDIKVQLHITQTLLELFMSYTAYEAASMHFTRLEIGCLEKQICFECTYTFSTRYPAIK